MERTAFMGPRLRRLRRELGLTQPGMAADLGVSASYVSLLESNQRPVTADMLLRLARTYRIDLADFAGDGGAEMAERMRTALRDPLFADIDLPALHVADVAANYPGIAEAFLRLQSAHRAEQLALARRPGGEEGAEAVTAVRRFLAARENAVPELDEAGEALAAAIRGAGGEAARLEERHGLRVRIVPGEVLAGLIRRHDPHNRAVFLDERLAPDERAFQLALQIAYLELAPALDALVGQAEPADGNARRLLRRALAGYAAAAIRMPRAAFAAAAAETGCDVELLARRFGTGVERTAYRLTSLARAGLPAFSFVRLDAAGNVSKRVDGAGFPVGEAGGCPLWSAHRVLRSPGGVATQWLELPDGRRFFSVAFAVVSGGGGRNAPWAERAVALVCAAGDAGRLVYARGDARADAPDPVGIACRLCQRDACAARSAPPIGRAILPDDNHRRAAPYAFDDG